jgi:transposase-like protein
MATVREKAMCVLRFFETKSVIKIQRRYRTQCRKDPPTNNDIRRWLKQFQENGSVPHRKIEERANYSQKTLIESRKRFLEAQEDQLDELYHSAVLIL